MKPWSTLRTFLQQDPAGKPPPLSDSEASVKQSPGSQDPLRSVRLSPWSPRAPARSQPGWSGYGDSAGRPLGLYPFGLGLRALATLSPDPRGARPKVSPGASQPRVAPSKRPERPGLPRPRGETCAPASARQAQLGRRSRFQKNPGRKIALQQGRWTARCSGPSPIRT